MRRGWIFAALFLLAASSGAVAETGLADRLMALGASPCADSDLTCLTLPMPVDRRANDPEKTVDITFAVSLATEDSKGILFYFVGGPGGSGLAAAPDYLPYIDENLTAQMDIVFVDQRGTGSVHGLDCPAAQARLDSADTSPDRPEEAIALAKAYVDGCIAELDVGDFLAHVTTDEAIADSEAFRAAIGAPKVWLYGESYGTQLVQAYATQHPDAVRGVIIDGVVDLNLSTEGFYAAYIRAGERLLGQVFAACRNLPHCADDMGGEAMAVYDRLAESLAKAPLPVDFVLADGSVAQRQMTKALLEAAAFNALYGPDGKAGFLRALAAAGRGDMVPLLLNAYGSLSIDPQTMQGEHDPAWSGAAYYAITCTDYGSGVGTPDENARAIMDEARALAPEAPRLLRSYYMERLVCAYWPHQGPEARPEPFAGGDYPTLVLNGDADPITPITMSYSVLDHARNSYGIFQKGGPHVIYGRETGCPDVTVNDVLLKATLPPAREMQCATDFVGSYTPLTLIEASAGSDPLALVRAVETEVEQSEELAIWDGEDPVTIGCNHGGTLTATPTDTGTDYAFAGCAFWPGLSVSGKGALTDDDGDKDGLALDLDVSGGHQGALSYRRSEAAESWYLSGRYDGKDVGTTRTYP